MNAYLERFPLKNGAKVDCGYSNGCHNNDQRQNTNDSNNQLSVR